jgi:hypothetical protein
MKNYPTIQSSPVSFTVTIIGYSVPHIVDQTYTQYSAPMTISIDAFKILPVNYNVGPNSVDAYVYEGSKLFDSLDLQCDCLLKVKDLNWISFDKDTK